MKKYFPLIFFFCACKTEIPDLEFIESKFEPVYFLQSCNGDVCGYTHTLMLDNYNDELFSRYDFIYLADKYLDSVKTNLPIRSVVFVRPFDFQPVNDSEDDSKIIDHSIAKINYTDETMSFKIPEISSVSIWIDGHEHRLDYMQVSSRQQRMEYYQSNKK